MDADPDLHKMSHRLSRVLDDVGASKSMIVRRRRKFLLRENMFTIHLRLMGNGVTVYHFGSQSEGTTTPGMGSDLDTLYDHNRHQVIMDWSEWQYGKLNVLMLKDDTTPPRHCNLQLLRDDTPQAVTDIIEPDHTRDIHGRILVNNTFYDTEFKSVLRPGQKYVKNGPSGSPFPDQDIVCAFHCARLPAECRTWLTRPRPGHWPAPHILQQASECGTFVVPCGHPDSENERVEWRFSTSIIERILMFTLNTVQLKTYIVLKMIKNTYFKPIVGDRLSSFHCKCAVLFTVENTPPAIWSDEKLVYCVMCCLNTLKRWLMRGFCPHYVIPSMNLFTGKLVRHQLVKLTRIISGMIDNNLQCIYNIQMDGVGGRMILGKSGQRCEQMEFPARYTNHCDITADLSIRAMLKHVVCNVTLYMNTVNQCGYGDALKAIVENMSRCVIDTNHVDIHMRSALLLSIPHLVSMLASMQASMCIMYRLPFSQHILNLYTVSFNTDVVSTRLKFASMCYCKGELELAADVLNYIEHNYKPYVIPICGCSGRHREPTPRSEFKSCALLLSAEELTRTSVTFCVRFTRHERGCVPEHFQYEMNRGIGDDVYYRDERLQGWMDMAVVDSLPYLYYLQYLTFGGLGRRHHQITAIENLRKCAFDTDNLPYHYETVFNLLGHCYELEHRVDLELLCYQTSLKLVPRNNAASWHIMRL